MAAHPAQEPPSGAGWIREIKHDGFRIVARRDGTRVLPYTRDGYDFADRFPQIVEAISDGGDAAVIYTHVCKFGCEGIVSKRLGSPYRSGRSDH